MPASFQRLFALMGLVLTFFIVLEIALEIRAVSRGWQGPWLQQLQNTFSSLNPPEIKSGKKTPAGPPAGFSGNRTQMKILVLGSSHSIDPKYSPEDIWPSVMGRTLRAIGNERGMDRLSHVEIINASQIGLSLPTGYAQLKTALGRYEPDAVILYELTNTINSYSETILSGAGRPPPQADGGPGASAGSPPGRSRGGLPLLSMAGIQPLLSEFLADTTVYEQVKSKVGVRFVGLTPKEDYIGSAGEAMLRNDLEKYLSLCRAFNVRLILTEAVTGFDYDLPMGILEDQVLSCYRYNSMLSATGWKATVTGFNQLTRYFAETNQLAFISVRSALTRPEEQLRDVVHFTREGHHCMGETMAESLFRLLKGSPSEAR
jgi:hypothetical protein